MGSSWGVRPGPAASPNPAARWDAGRGNQGNFTHPLAGHQHFERSIAAGRPGYISNYHAGWHHGYWHGHWGGLGYGWPMFWGGVGVGVGGGMIAYSTGYWPYYNPFYGPTVVVQYPYLDYSHPLPVATAQLANSEAALHFNIARGAFRSGRYKIALDEVDLAVREVPSDSTMHEFRALVLFALQDYSAAAAALYAVLSVRPGWDWTTLSGLYADRDMYIQHVRALDHFRRQHPDSADAHFLLAYHYMTTGNTDAAAAELDDVLRLIPNDRLAKQLLRMVRRDPLPDPQGPRPAVEAPALAGEAPQPPGTPPDRRDPARSAPPPVLGMLWGTWNASRAEDQSKFNLQLNEDRSFVWTFSSAGATREVKGSYSLEGNLLELNQSDGNAMVGRLTGASAQQFHFRLVGATPDDPGLDFRKM